VQGQRAFTAAIATKSDKAGQTLAIPDAVADRAGLAAARQRSSTSIIISPGSALISVPLQPNLPMSPDGCRLDSWVASSRLSSAKPRPSIAT